MNEITEQVNLLFFFFLGTAKIQAGKTSQTHQNNSTVLQHTDENFGKSIKDFPAALKVKLN
jgi:hypothetical protein